MSKYYCVLDFEATCDGTENFPNEIIEFPSVLMDNDMNVISEFREFVKPIRNPKLHPFCTKLTGITQEQVDSGEYFVDVIKRHQKWIFKHVGTDPVLFITCGKWDLYTQLPKECEMNGIKVPNIYKNWIDIKIPFKKNFPNNKGSSMEKMLEFFGEKLEGHHHSGIDDCRNICKVVKHLKKYI